MKDSANTKSSQLLNPNMHCNSKTAMFQIQGPLSHSLLIGKVPNNGFEISWSQFTCYGMNHSQTFSVLHPVCFHDTACPKPNSPCEVHHGEYMIIGFINLLLRLQLGNCPNVQAPILRPHVCDSRVSKTANAKLCNNLHLRCNGRFFGNITSVYGWFVCPLQSWDPM